MKTNYSHSATSPEAVQSIGTPEKPLYQINFDTEEIQELQGDGNSSSGQSLSTQYRSLYVQVSEIDYNTLVSAIIACRYTSSDTEAIVLNNLEAQDATSSLTEEKRAEYVAEYQALQAWRTHAKEMAKSILS
jgi:hypothetical protein